MCTYTFFFKLLSESEQHLLEMHNAKEKTENEKEDLNQQVNVLTRQGIKFCMYTQIRIVIFGQLHRKLEDLQFQMEEEAVKKMDQLKVS